MADTPRLRDRSRSARRRGPIFVDASGRSLGRVRVIGGAALAAVAGYMVLLVVAVLGGPNVAAPYLQPLVKAPQAAPAPATTGTPAPQPAADAPESVAGAVPAAVAVPVSAQPAPAAVPAEGAPVAAPSAPAAAVPSAPVDPGKSESAPGQTSRPTAPAKP
ncbi:hypothetical protein [Sinomonas mesophila]|uniref:hypothetical protein n=1 Tax=Sinomonas mesophila TaxID=1531955 RepID=UPI00111569D0|nr:hypothetical protein [Sinomonas mesophila]